MKLRSSFFALSLSTSLLAGVARAQAPAAPTPPPANPTPAVEGTVTNRALPDRSRSSSLEGLEPQPGGLTSQEVARRALLASASVKEKRAQLQAANEKITQTTFQFFPRATLIASYTRTSPIEITFGLPPGVAAGPGGLSISFPQDNYVLNARLSIPISDYMLRVADAAAASSSSRDAARLSVDAAKAKVISDAKSLYFNWLRALAQSAVAKNAVERTRARLEDARATFSAGQISKADLMRLEALVANTELVATRADSMVALTTGQLGIIMEDPKPGYRVGEGIPPLADVPEAHQDVKALVGEALGRRLEVQSIDAATKALDKGASAVRTSALPRVEALGDVLYANPNPKYFPPGPEWHWTWSAGVQATWTIGDTFFNLAAARELDAQSKATQAQKIALRAGISQEVLSSYLDLTRAQAAFEQQKAALAAAEEGYRVTTDLFKAGRATSTDLVLSEGELLDAKLGDVNARIDLTIATIALRHATARDLAPAKAAQN